MKITREKRQRIYEILMGVLVFVCIIETGSFTPSHSLYLNENNSALTYQTQLTQLYYKDAIVVGRNNASTSTNILLDFTITPNTVAKDGEKDSYTLTIPKGCSVSGLSNPNDHGNLRTYSLTLTATKSFSANCEIAKILENDSFEVPIVVEEKIGNEDTFRYTDGGYPKTSLSEYYKFRPVVTPNGSTFTFHKNSSRQEVSAKFSSWLSDYLSRVAGNQASSYSKVLSDYIKTVYNDYQGNNPATLFDAQLILKGLQSKYDDNTGIYTYTVEDNLLGYARTNAESNKNWIYFSTTNPTEMEEAFLDHLKNNYNETEYDLIKRYVDSFTTSSVRGLQYILSFANNSNNGVSGFNVSKYSSDHLLVLMDNIVTIAEIKLTGSIRIEANRAWNKMYNDFVPALKTAYEDIMSESVYQKFYQMKYLDILVSISNNSDQAAWDSLQSGQTIIHGAFQDLFLIYDDEKKHYLFLDVSSTDGTENLVSMQAIMVDDKMKMQLTDKKGSLKIEIAGYTEDQILSSLSADYHNKVNITEDGLLTILITNESTKDEILDIIEQINLYVNTHPSQSVDNNSDASDDTSKEEVTSPTEDVNTSEEVVANPDTFASSNVSEKEIEDNKKENAEMQSSENIKVQEIIENDELEEVVIKDEPDTSLDKTEELIENNEETIAK